MRRLWITMMTAAVVATAGGEAMAQGPPPGGPHPQRIAAALGLTDEQKAVWDTAFSTMKATAQPLHAQAKAIRVEIDALFAQGNPDPGAPRAEDDRDARGAGAVAPGPGDDGEHHDRGAHGRAEAEAGCHQGGASAAPRAAVGRPAALQPVGSGRKGVPSVPRCGRRGTPYTVDNAHDDLSCAPASGPSSRCAPASSGLGCSSTDGPRSWPGRSRIACGPAWRPPPSGSAMTCPARWAELLRAFRPAPRSGADDEQRYARQVEEWKTEAADPGLLRLGPDRA